MKYILKIYLTKYILDKIKKEGNDHQINILSIDKQIILVSTLGKV